VAHALHMQPRLGRTLALSAAAHVIAVIVLRVVLPSVEVKETEKIDIEIAPAPPKAEALPEETARAEAAEAEAAAAAAAAKEAAAKEAEEAALAGKKPAEDEPGVAMDAGVADAPIDAAIDAATRMVAVADARVRPDAVRADAGVDAAIDAGTDAGIDAATPMVAAADAGAADGGGSGERVAVADAGGGSGQRVAVADAGSGSGERVAAAGSGSGSGERVAAAGSGSGSGERVAAAGSGSGSGTGSGLGLGLGFGSGSGVGLGVGSGGGSGLAVDNQPAVDGEPTTAGTAANLLAYFPPGHIITALVRFDRLRNTEWAAQTERVLRPLPDHRTLFGGKATRLSEKLDTLVISSPSPRDASATTLVAHTALSRAEIRELLENPRTPIAWSTARGGMLGKRSGRVFPGDKRLVLSPWPGWFLLAQPADLGTLPNAATGDLDQISATGKLPAWLQTIRKIEEESGTDKRGPALVVTVAGDGKPYTFPDVGLGITSLPSPKRISLAMELVAQGWLLRGNIAFAKESEAKEFVTALEDAQQRISDSYVLSKMLASQHLLNVVKGLSFARTGSRVSYATSLSIADARTLLTAAALTLDDFFKQAP
jgi:hypothetical protein